jgi:hypothetical protein
MAGAVVPRRDALGEMEHVFDESAVPAGGHQVRARVRLG